ncbi:DNA-binding transcriptional regulator DsdC [Pseudomonas laurentiana]
MNKLSGAAAVKLNGSHLGGLHVFLVAARHLSFSQAADELCLTASAVSHRISRLEAELRLKLFHRLPRKVSLTEDGERLFSVMQRTMDELSEAIHERSDAEIAGQLTLYVRPSIAQCWLVPRIAEFTSRYPDIQLDIRVGNESIDHRTRKIDLVLCYSDGNHPGLSTVRLMGERIAPVCSPQYAEAHQLTGNPDQLTTCTALHDIAAWDNAAFDAEWRLWGQSTEHPLQLPKRFLTFDRSDLCTLAALNHAGVAIGREQLIKERVLQGDLILPFGGFVSTPNYGYYLVHPTHEQTPRRLQVLVEWLANCVDATTP